MGHGVHAARDQDAEGNIEGEFRIVDQRLRLHAGRGVLHPPAVPDDALKGGGLRPRKGGGNGDDRDVEFERDGLGEPDRVAAAE
jgi:hypothetical protein